ncbi:hypothetical protein HDU96_006332 [Phlyctochytrium bullatum]|nr:hypothetical protein HDU96_006332 [Phlyctochytrium bullatum]
MDFSTVPVFEDGIGEPSKPSGEEDTPEEVGKILVENDVTSTKRNEVELIPTIAHGFADKNIDTTVIGRDGLERQHEKDSGIFQPQILKPKRHAGSGGESAFATWEHRTSDQSELSGIEMYGGAENARQQETGRPLRRTTHIQGNEEAQAAPYTRKASRNSAEIKPHELKSSDSKQEREHVLLSWRRESDESTVVRPAQFPSKVTAILQHERNSLETSRDSEGEGHIRASQNSGWKEHHIDTKEGPWQKVKAAAPLEAAEVHRSYVAEGDIGRRSFHTQDQDGHHHPRNKAAHSSLKDFDIVMTNIKQMLSSAALGNENSHDIASANGN